MKPDYTLYLVTDRYLVGTKDFYRTIEAAIEGGITVLQLREKELSTREFYQTALKVKDIAARHNIPFIINDRVDIALAVDADGLHIGQDDLPVPVARKLLGADKIIGLSAGTIQEALLGQEQGADYLGVGAVFATATKKDADMVTMDELRRIKKAVRIPVVAIGGINENNAAEVMATGVDGICVVSAIVAKDDARAAARTLKQLVTKR